MLEGLGALLAGSPSPLRLDLLGPILRGTALGDLEAEGLADVQLCTDKRSDEALPSLVLNAADGAHLVQHIHGCGELLFQLVLPDMLHLRGEDHRHEEDEQHPVLALLRPAALAVEAELGLHLPEVLLLLVADLVVPQGLHRGLIQRERNVGEEARRLPGVEDLLLVDGEGNDGRVLLAAADIEPVVVLPDGSVIVQGEAFLLDLLQGETLGLDFGIQRGEVFRPADGIEVQVQTHPVRLVNRVAVAFDLVVNIVLLVIDPRLDVDVHPLRTPVDRAELKYPFQDHALMDAHTHDHRLPAQDVPLHVLDGLVPAVRDEDHAREARMVQLRQQRLDAPRIRDVARELPVVHRHVRGQGIHHQGRGLLQREMLLVVPAVDVGEGTAVGGPGRGVHCAELVLPQALGAVTEQVHPVLLGDALRQARYRRRVELRPGRRLHHPLPARHPAVVVPRHYRIIRERENVVHHLGVPAEHGHQILTQASAVRNPLQQPDVTVQAVHVLPLIRHAARFAVRGQLVYLAQVPPFRKDEFAALLHGSIQVPLPGNELQLRGEPPPVEQAVLPLSVIGQRVWMGAGVRVASVPVGRQPVDAVLFCGSGHGIVLSCINYTNV